ncbi:MAG: tetratricopeptide repeat protein [Nitrospira sp.]
MDLPTPRHRYLWLLLCASTVAAYWTGFSGDFHYDDGVAIFENPHLESWRHYFGHLDHMVRPVLYATFLFDRRLYGGEPAGYHLLNLLLHVGSGLLIFRILRSAVADERSSIPFWTSLFFLLHPIATETVTYISGRASGLMAFCYLGALLLYVRATERIGSGHVSQAPFIASIALFLLAIGSKETAITFPIILLLWDHVIRRKQGDELRTALFPHHLPFWIVLLLAAGWAMWHPRYHALAQFSFNLRPWSDNLLSEVYATAYALLLCFTPWNQNFDHDLPVFHSLAQRPLPLDLLFLSILAGGAFIARRRFPLVAFGIAWFFLQLLPTSLIPRTDLLSERNLYLPALGLLIALVSFGAHIKKRLSIALPRPAVVRAASLSFAVALALTLGLSTIQRNELYRDQLSLWADATLKSPNKARPHNNLGRAYALQGDWDRAIEEFRIAARLDPTFILAQQNLRDAYLHHVGRR